MRIGFIGLGNMGGPMALNLIKAGHSVVVYDLRKELAQEHLAAGATWADSTAEATHDRELVMTSLPGPREVEQVANGRGGIFDSIAEGALYADLSTISPTLIRRIHATFARKGNPVLDAPVSGGVPGARNATLAIMVGGEEAAFARARPAFESIGNKISHIGPSGAGAVAKLVHNMLAICSTQLLAEAFTLGIKAGVQPQALLAAVRDGAYGQGMLLSGMLPKMVFRGRFDRAAFALKLARKDLGLATELSREMEVPMPLAAMVEQDLLTALAHGLGDKDSSAAFTVQEERAGVKVRE